MSSEYPSLVEAIFDGTATAPATYEFYRHAEFYTELASTVCTKLKSTVADTVTEQWHANADSFLKYILDWYPDEEVAPAVKMALTEYQLPLDASKLNSFDSHDGRLTKMVMASLSRPVDTNE